MAARSFRMYPPVSKASKPKGRGWERAQRFSGGHDAGCLGLLPEELRMATGQLKRPTRVKTRVFRAASFGLNREERIVEDALFLLNHGHVSTLEEAIEKAIKNNPAPEDHNVILVAPRSDFKANK